MRTLHPTEKGERKDRVLQAVAEEFIRTGRPISSGQLSERASLRLSAPALRLVLAELEEEGLLTHPHTSAGKFPTDKGYRAYADRLLARGTRGSGNNSLRDLRERFWDYGGMMSALAQRVSERTGCAAFVFAPGTEVLRWRRVEFIHVERDRYLTVFIAEPGVVKYSHTISPSVVPQEWLNALSALLNDVGTMMPTPGWDRSLAQRAKAVFADVDARSWAKQMLREVFGPSKQDGFFFDGASHLFSAEDLQGRAFAGVVKLLEDEHALARLLADELFDANAAFSPGAVSVRIGGENRASALRNFSEVYAPYVVNGRAAGVVGVIGPRRLDYARACAAVRETAQALQDLFSSRSGVVSGHEVGWPAARVAAGRE